MADSQAHFESLGFNSWVAEGLEGMELTELDVQCMSHTEILDKAFTYHGFIGFTETIIEAVDNVRKVEEEQGW